MELRDKIIIGSTLLFGTIISGSVFFVNVVVPQRALSEKISKDYEERFKQSSALRVLSACKASAEETYYDDWELNCKDFGLNGDKTFSCALPTKIIENIDKRKKQSFDECYREYSYKIK